MDLRILCLFLPEMVLKYKRNIMHRDRTRDFFIGEVTMKTGLRAVLVISVAVLSAAFLPGCRVKNVQSASPSVPLTLVSITIQPSLPSMAPGTTLQLAAVGRFSNNAQLDLSNRVVWGSANPAVATVDGTGLAASTGSTGSTTITATLEGISGTTVLTSSPIVSIAVTPADRTIAAGTPMQFAAIGTLLNGATQNITSFASWDSSNAAAATVSGAGLASTTPSSTGSTTITAAFGAISGTTTLTAAAVTSIAVTPANATSPLGTTLQFAAAGGLSNGASQDLTSFATWATSNAAIATVGNTTGSKGLATAVGLGTVFVTAAFANVTSNAATLTVNPAVVVSIAVTPANPSVALGLTQQFTAIGTFSDGTTGDITASAAWTSSDTQVATIAGTSGKAATLASGTTVITAALSGVTSNQATLTVTPVALVSITVTPSNPGIVIGLAVQFTATGRFSDGTTQDMTSTVTWSSSLGSVAIISNAPGSQGLANSFGVGSTTITAVSGNVSGNTTLTVTFF